MSLMLGNNRTIKNELVDHVIASERYFFGDWINDNNLENYQEYLESCSNHVYVKAYCVRYGKRETRKMLREEWNDRDIDH